MNRSANWKRTATRLPLPRAISTRKSKPGLPTRDEPQLETNGGDVLLNPVVLLQVLSDSTEAYDRGKKFEHYRTIPSLQHYVLVAQDRHSIDCFSRKPDGSWTLHSCQTLDDKVGLAAIDCQLLASEVYDKVVFQDQADSSS